MTRKNLILFLLASLFSAPAIHASIDLIAIGSVSGTYEDFATETAGALENDVAGNLLGGVGSGIAYAGGNTFIAIPDRGPNATTYDPDIDNTTSYINRFQTFNLSLALNPSYDPTQPSSLPFTLTPFLTATTLLWNKKPLVYGTGAGLDVGSGMPVLNAKHTNYFTGRSDNFDPTKISTNPNNARFDPEGIRVSKDGQSVFISDEYGPYVYQFDRATGERINVFVLPTEFAVSNLSPVGGTEISGNTSGRVANKGMEGLAITPDGGTLVGIMQSPLLQDGGTNGPITRIVTIDIKTGVTHEYGYEFDNIGTPAKPKYGTASEIVAINEHEFLVDERDGKGLGDGSTAVLKRLYHIDLNGAQEVSAITGAANLAGKAVVKVLFLDIVAELNHHDIASTNIPAKLEGVAFGQDIVVTGVTKHTLYVTNDNDFTATVGGVDNPNQFFVFAVDSADLPGFVPQQIKSINVCTP
jgi:hypothetical protein